MHLHKQVEVIYQGHQITIDEGLKELLPLIWKFGIKTELSCQENKPGIAWISFNTSHDAKMFLNLAAVYPEDDVPLWETMCGRILQYGEKDNWQYESVIINNAEITNPETKNIDVNISISVRFPVTDINEITKNLSNRIFHDKLLVRH
ncbi:MAG: hypothetical protein DWQ19_12270 [Crenarchaeota archaeon]|nr:MAG: hypothetical protein DWQ19_12270 [Thermoproteota archaeon]